MTLPAGSKLGPYEIVSPLGAGGMGEVYRARDTRLGREVAVKVLPESLAEDRDRLSRFEREARAASALNHPNIVTIHDVGREGETAYLAMELVDGRTLRELSVSGPMPLRRILNVFSQIADGLAKAHAAGIVHRDLKPENVMVSKDGFVKILDFGLAKLVEPSSGELSVMPTVAETETRPGTVMGTVTYMSPEQASGEPLDFRSDQFSLGSILYETATGQKAFQRKTAAETMSAIIRDEPEPVGKLRPEIPLPVRWMIERCLAKEPEERYASTRDLARDLASVRDHISEVTSGSEALLAATKRPRRRAPVLGIGIALLVAGGVAGWLARGRSGAPQTVPRFTRLTFRQGLIGNARFAPDGRTIVYGANWAGDPPGRSLYRTQVGSPESAKFDFPGDILAISPSNELAILQMPPARSFGTLARVPMSGGTPRGVLEDVPYDGADFSPDGKELAAARFVGGRIRLEFPIGKVLVASGVYTPRVSRDGRSLAVWMEVNGTNAVGVIGRDGGPPRVLSEGWIDVDGAPCWSSDGREIWFTAHEKSGEPSSLWAVDLSGHRRLLVRVPGSIELDDVDAAGRVLLGHHTLAQSLRFATASDPRERELAWLDRSELVDLSADGKTVLFGEVGEGSGSMPVVYLRSTDGSPAVKLGEGDAFALSPDGRWVLAAIPPGGGKGPVLVLLPTGPGEAHPLLGRGFVDYGWGAFLPDGKKVVYSAVAKGGGSRLYVQEIPGGEPQPLGPEGLRIDHWVNPVSPDGKRVVGVGGGRAYLVALDGASPARALDGIAARDETILQWAADSRHLYVFRLLERPARVWLYDLETTHRQLWKDFPFDASIFGVFPRMTPDGRAWVYAVRRIMGALYLVEGLH